METVRFDQLDLYPQVLRAIAEMGFEEATPIQAKAIPAAPPPPDWTGTDRNRKDGIIWNPGTA